MQIYTALVHHVGYTHKEPFHSNLATMTMAGLASPTPFDQKRKAYGISEPHACVKDALYRLRQLGNTLMLMIAPETCIIDPLGRIDQIGGGIGFEKRGCSDDCTTCLGINFPTINFPRMF